MHAELPIAALKPAFLAALGNSLVVVSSPTVGKIDRGAAVVSWHCGS